MELAPKNGPKGTMISMNHCKKELKDTQESVLFLSEFHEKTLDIFKSVKTDPIKNKEIRRKTPNGFAEMSLNFLLVNYILI